MRLPSFDVTVQNIRVAEQTNFSFIIQLANNANAAALIRIGSSENDERVLVADMSDDAVDETVKPAVSIAAATAAATQADVEELTKSEKARLKAMLPILNDLSQELDGLDFVQQSSKQVSTLCECLK
jgi:hypothetical protein